MGLTVTFSFKKQLLLLLQYFQIWMTPTSCCGLVQLLSCGLCSVFGHKRERRGESRECVQLSGREEVMEKLLPPAEEFEKEWVLEFHG